MKILMVSELFYPKLRGGEVVLWRVARALAERGHKVKVVTARLDDIAALEEIDGVEVRRPLALASPGKSNSFRMALGKIAFMVRLHRCLIRLLKEDRPDLIYNNAYTVTLPSGWVGRKHGIPVVTNIGNLQGAGHRASSGWSPLGWIQQFKEWIILRYGGHQAIRVASEAVAQQVRRLTRADVYVIPSPIDDQVVQRVRESFDPASIRAEFDVNDNELLMLFVGALEPVKNVDGLINVVSRVNRPLRLLLVGTGREGPRLREQVDRLGLGERIVFLGKQRHDRVLELMAASDGLLLASKSENLPTVVLEALSVGTPVISTDVGGVGEISSSNLTLVKSVEEIGEVIDKGFARYEDRSVLEAYATDPIAHGFERMFEAVMEYLPKNADQRGA